MFELYGYKIYCADEDREAIFKYIEVYIKAHSHLTVDTVMTNISEMDSIITIGIDGNWRNICLRVRRIT